MAGAVWRSLPFPAAQAWFHLGAFPSGGGLREEGTQLLCFPQIRYQRVSPDALPLANGRKPTPRTCKEEEADNGRLSFTTNGGAFDGKSLRYRPGTSPSSAAGLDPNFPPSDSPQSDNHLHHQHPTRTAHDGGGAAILQWGQNKRSRGSRAERAATPAGGEESSSPARQVIKIHRRAATAVGGGEKPSSMAPPCGAAPYSRGTNLRPAMTVRDHHHSGPLLNRSASDDHRSAAASPARAHNGSGPRAHPHRTTAGEKRPPASPDNHHHSATASKPAGGPNQLEAKSSAETETAGAAEKVSLELFEWPRIYLSLSRKEKEDDFLAMKGTKLPQRPKKRAKNVDKTLQYCFPGMWLSDLTRGRYEVREKKCVKKRRRGLKGMESMESESE